MHNKEELEQSKVTYHRLISDSITIVPSKPADTTELEMSSSVALPTLSYVELCLIGISMFIIVSLLLIAMCIYSWKHKNQSTVAGKLL